MSDFVDPFALVADLAGQAPVFFVPNGGNLGDSLIAAATMQGLTRIGVNWTMLHGNEHRVTRDSVIIHGGGGSLNGLYPGAIKVLEWINRFNSRVIVFPQTVRSYKNFWLNNPNVIVLCRDETSFEYLCGIGRSQNIHLAHDVATTLRVKDAPFTSVHRYRQALLAQKQDDPAWAVQTLTAFRTDNEAKSNPTTTHAASVDLSEFGHVIPDRDAIYAQAIFFLTALASWSGVSTDRLHIAVGASLLGLNVRLYDNSYGKNRGVFEVTLKNLFPNLTFAS